MGRRIRVEDDHIIEVGRHLCQTFNGLVNHSDEPARPSTPGLGHDEPLVEARGGETHCERDGILVRGNQVEQGDQVKGKTPVPSPGSRGLGPREE